MSETTNENLQEIHDGNQNELDVSVSSENSKPASIGSKSIIVEVEMFENGTQNINVKTPDRSTVADNIGMLEIAKHILLKDKF